MSQVRCLDWRSRKGSPWPAKCCQSCRTLRNEDWRRGVSRRGRLGCSRDPLLPCLAQTSPRRTLVSLSSNQIAALRALSSPTVANAIETFKVRPREAGNLSSEIRALFTGLGSAVGYAVTALVLAEYPAPEAKWASTFAWWDYIQPIPAPRILVLHDLDLPRR